MTAISEKQRQALMTELQGLKRFCVSLTGNHADAEDLLQLTVERILDKGMPSDAHVAKWSFRVCRNIWLDELRSRDVRYRYAQGEIAVNSETPTSSAHSEGVLELERVEKLMHALPEEQRLALVLVAVEGRSYAEVADILDIPIGTVMSRVARARRALVEKSS